MRTLLLAATIGIPLAHSAQTFTTWTTADGLPANDLRDVAIAPDGAVWIATQLGVARFDGGTFTVHNTSSHPGLANNDVQAIAVAPNGEVWAGTDFGVSHFDGTAYTTYTTADGLGDDEVKCVRVAPNGDVWIGTINGVTRYSGGTFTAWGMPDLPFGGVWHIAFAGNTVWLSGGLGGAIRYSGGTFTAVTTTQGLISDRIRSIAIDGSARKWVGTAEGISVLDANDMHLVDHTRMLQLPPPDTLNPVTDVAVDASGRVWAAIYVDYLVTEGGVAVYDGQDWTQFETSDGLAGPNVRRLAVDADEAVWVTTSTGLTRISGVTIGIAEQRRAAVGLFPNPASVQVQVVLERPVAGTPVEVFDAAGRSVMRHPVMGDRQLLDVSALAPGLYTVRVSGAVSRLLVTR